MLVLVTIVVIAYFYYHVTAFLEPDWRALYSAPGHGPDTHLTRPLLSGGFRGVSYVSMDTPFRQIHNINYLLSNTPLVLLK